MLNNKTVARHGHHIDKFKLFRVLAPVFLIVCIIGIAVVLQAKDSQADTGKITRNDKRELSRLWAESDFDAAYILSKEALNIKPVDFSLLTINGFSAFQLGISQINNQNRLYYMNESINSLRKAMLLKEASNDGRIFYVLGKSYYYKGNDYSDLAVKYLDMAYNLNYEAKDIPEFLGLSYAASGDYRSSVNAFSQAFEDNKPPSDSLLLSIARSYMAMEEYNMAVGYLSRCVDTSPDSQSVIIAHFLLAEIYKNTGDYQMAERQYFSILESSGENAEVRFQLGELYNLLGDTTRARAEWRIAFRQDPTHARARARLNI